MRLIYCDKCDGEPLTTRLQDTAFVETKWWMGACPCGGTKRIVVLKDHQKRGIASRKELRELERIAGLPYPQVNTGVIK